LRIVSTETTTYSPVASPVPTEIHPSNLTVSNIIDPAQPYITIAPNPEPCQPPIQQPIQQPIQPFSINQSADVPSPLNSNPATPVPCMTYSNPVTPIETMLMSNPTTPSSYQTMATSNPTAPSSNPLTNLLAESNLLNSPQPTICSPNPASFPTPDPLVLAMSMPVPDPLAMTQPPAPTGGLFGGPAEPVVQFTLFSNYSAFFDSDNEDDEKPVETEAQSSSNAPTTSDNGLDRAQDTAEAKHPSTENNENHIPNNIPQIKPVEVEHSAIHRRECGKSSLGPFS